MENVKVVHYPDSHQYFECDYCNGELMDEVWFVCVWDTEHKRHYISKILCKVHIDEHA